MLARAHFIALLVLAALGCALSAVGYFQLPDQVPVHWNIHGVADRMGSKWELLLIMPSVGIVMTALAPLLPRLGPFRQNFAQFRITYGRIFVMLLTVFLGLHAVILLKAAGAQLAIGPALAVLIGLMIAVLGNWLGKVRRNFYIGIRTPWTLASQEVWERTHHAGARIFVIWGLAMMAGGFTGSNTIAFVACIGGVVVVAIWSLVYSAWWYHRLGARDDTATPQ